MGVSGGCCEPPSLQAGASSEGWPALGRGTTWLREKMHQSVWWPAEGPHRLGVGVVCMGQRGQDHRWHCCWGSEQNLVLRGDGADRGRGQTIEGFGGLARSLGCCLLTEGATETYKQGSDMIWFLSLLCGGLPWWLSGKESVCNAGDQGSIPGLGKSPGEGNGYPLQYSYLENSTDLGAWWATVQGVAKSRTRLSS